MSVTLPTPPVTALPLSAKQSRTTPWLLSAALAAICLTSLLLFFAVTVSTRQHQDAIKTVGKDAAPSIVAAQRIKASLADMDANVANELIAKPGQNRDSVQGYEARRVEVSDALVGAAENITYGDAERLPIKTLTYNLGTYEVLVAEARLLHARGGDVSTLRTYEQANTIMHGTLLPAADALDKANKEVLERVYAQQKTNSSATAALVWIAGLFLLGVLITTQIFLSRRTHRLLNPPLLGATAVSLVFLLYASAQLGAASRDLKGAKQDAFDSVYALWHARAVAYDANADESRWLIDRAQAKEYQESFFAKAGQIAALPPNATYDSVASACQAGQIGTVPASFTGYLADELRNITFVGEQDAADETLRTWGRYIVLDGQIRALENAGRHADAVTLCVGNAPGQSNWAYNQFDAALGKTLTINENALTHSVAAGFADLNALPWLTPIALLLVALLCWFGLSPRLREYRG